MDWLKLPRPETNTPPSFTDALNARIWLADQPPAQPIPSLKALTREIVALDGALLEPNNLLAALGVMQSAATPLYAAVETRFLRKPLPMAEGEWQAFEAARNIWWKLALAYFRCAQRMPGNEQALPLLRSANALRIVKYCHFQAAVEVPEAIDELLFGLLGQGQLAGVLTQTVNDNEFPQTGESKLSGHLAWIFLLTLIAPYSLSAVQLGVANRSLSRWRELCEFRAKPSSDPRGHSLDLAPLFTEPNYPPGVPRWLELSKVSYKMAGRIKALREGHSPESLKLGRELSAAACLRLFNHIENALDMPMAEGHDEQGNIELSFGCSHAYLHLKGEELKKPERFNATSSQISHQRISIFGFDNIAEVTDKPQIPKPPAETWTALDGYVQRTLAQGGEKRTSPSLVSARINNKPRLGILRGLRQNPQGTISGDLDWCGDRVEPGYIASKPGAADTTRTPVFLVRQGDSLSLIAPADAQIRLNESIFPTDLSLGRIAIDAIIERGVDFTHYNVKNR